MNKEPVEVCEISVLHDDVLARVREKMPPEESIYEVSELFKYTSSLYFAKTTFL